MQTKSSHRGKLDIIAHILTSAVGGVRKTTIMYRCNLSFRQLEAYLGLLLSKELLQVLTRRESSASHYFETTERGLRFLKAYRNLNSLMKA
jgi:predicted transcriptional regulator